MNGARGIPETLAQKRIYIGTLPGWRKRQSGSWSA